MRILKLDKKHCLLKVVPQIEDDLWHLSQIIEKGDRVRGIASRKIKGDESRSAERRSIFVEIEVEKVSFQKEGNVLRVSGIVKKASDDSVPLGAAQSIEIMLNKEYTIIKSSIKKHQIERLKKAEKATRKAPIAIVCLDDELASIAILKEFGYEIKSNIRSGKSGKLLEESDWKPAYFNKLIKVLAENPTDTLIVAGPGFIKNEFAEFLKEHDFKGKLYIESSSHAGEAGINEIMKSHALAKITEDAEIVKEAMLIEKLLREIAKDGLATYGSEEVEKAASMHAVAELLVLDKKLVEERESVEKLMELVEKANGKVHIFNSEHEPGKKLEALGGVAAFLRYKVG